MKQTYFKSCHFGQKNSSVGVEATDELLSKINKYALKPLTSDEVYIRKFLMAHNAVDRDGERFSESILDDFAKTFVGKSFLKQHDRWDELPLGLFFDTVVKELSKDEFFSLTGETPRLPEGKDSVKTLWTWVYVLKTESREDLITHLEGGVYRHASIGFSAAELSPVKGKYDETLYWEYSGPGEALEGSLVWLGGQNGATAQKNKKVENIKEAKPMEFLKTLGVVIGKSLTEDNVVEVVKGLLEEKDQIISSLQTQIESSKSLIEEGKQYREGLVDEYARMKGALGEVETTDEAQKSIKSFASSFPILMLQKEVDFLEKRMEQKFSDTHQLHTEDINNNRGDGEENSLIPDES